MLVAVIVGLSLLCIVILLVGEALSSSGAGARSEEGAGEKT
jgi:hypothetical protein